MVAKKKNEAIEYKWAFGQKIPLDCPEWKVRLPSKDERSAEK